MDTEVKGSATAEKVKKLQKQYNKILSDLFNEHAKESIEEALEDNEGPLGENIDSIVSAATNTLRCKVLNDLGLSSPVEGEVQIAVGGFDLNDAVDLGDPEEEIESEEEEEEEEVAEEGKVPPQFADYIMKKKSAKKDKTCPKCKKLIGKCKCEKVEENYTAQYMGNDSPSQLLTDKSTSKSCREDQMSLTEAYDGEVRCNNNKES